MFEIILVIISATFGAVVGRKLLSNKSTFVEKSVKHEAKVPTPSSVMSTPQPKGEPRVGQDDPLDNKPWLAVVEECVELFDELARLKANFDPARQELIEHVETRLEELLVRSNVTLIANEATFDRNRHQPEQKGLHVSPRAAIGETLSPGFAVGRRVLRRSIVKMS